VNWKAQQSVTAVQIFIVLANFYQRFIENFAKGYKPIINMLETKGGTPLWFLGKEQNRAFVFLKGRFITALIVAYFYLDRETVIEIDTRDGALCCILS